MTRQLNPNTKGQAKRSEDITPGVVYSISKEAMVRKAIAGSFCRRRWSPCASTICAPAMAAFCNAVDIINAS
eukprot:jgi/Chlat1/3355/Chrsp23S03780